MIYWVFYFDVVNVSNIKNHWRILLLFFFLLVDSLNKIIYNYVCATCTLQCFSFIVAVVVLVAVSWMNRTIIILCARTYSHCLQLLLTTVIAALCLTLLLCEVYVLTENCFNMCSVQYSTWLYAFIDIRSKFVKLLCVYVFYSRHVYANCIYFFLDRKSIQ